MVYGTRYFVIATTMLSALTHVACLAQTSSALDEYREFKDQQGRTVTARIVDTSNDKVTIQRSDGRKFTLDISDLSRTDQDYIRGMTEPAPSFALTPIAHTDVVPYQRIEYGTSFDFGVVAFSKSGIDRVEFVISGQGYTGGTKISSSMALNTRVASTSPGAEYAGVYEYYVPISANAFTSNGTITVTPTVYGRDGGSIALDAVTLYVEGARDESPVKAWVDGTGGNDSTGAINDDTRPYRTMARAVTDIEAANGGNCDGAIVYFEEGVYDIGDGTTNTSNDRLTLTRAGGASIENVVIDDGGTSLSTRHLRISGVTIRSTGTHDKAITTPGVWIDHCRLVGSGRTLAGSNPVSAPESFWTGNYVYDVDFGIAGRVLLARGTKVQRIANDLAQNQVFVVNTVLDDIDPSGTGWHADVYQSWGAGPNNRIIYNLYATDVNYQGLFMRASKSDGSNMAIVNMFVELRQHTRGGGFSALTGNWDHLLMWHNTFVGSKPPPVSGWAQFLHTDEDPGDKYSHTNSSYIGNVFASWKRGGTPTVKDMFYFKNPYNNEGLYNHYEELVHDLNTAEVNTSTVGDNVIQLDTPGSATFGYPATDACIVNRLPSNLTGILGDALGNPRDSTPDVGALEATSNGR